MALQSPAQSPYQLDPIPDAYHMIAAVQVDCLRKHALVTVHAFLNQKERQRSGNGVAPLLVRIYEILPQRRTVPEFDSEGNPTGNNIVVWPSYDDLLAPPVQDVTGTNIINALYVGLLKAYVPDYKDAIDV